MTATQDALGRAAQTEALIEQEVGQLLDEVAGQKQAILDAVTEALASAGADQTAQDAAATALANKLDALQTKLSGALTPTPAAELPPLPETEEPPVPEPAPPAPLAFQGPTSITGASPTPLSGTFTVSGGTAPYTFAQDGALGDFTTTADGFYAMNPNSPATGTVNVVVTDAAGSSVSTPVSISVS